MFNSSFKKTGFLAALLSSALLLGNAVPVHAFDRDDKCVRRIRKAEDNLRKAERRHGEHSRQAEKRRHELEEARERCHQRDRDHDRDRDRDRDRH